MPIIVQAERPFRVGESDTLMVDCRAQGLRKNERITSVASVESVPAGLTVANGQTNAASLDVDGETVPAGMALLCTVTGGVAGKRYEVVFTLATTLSPTPTLKTQGIVVQCVA